jgi:hypothetical protein
MRRLVILVAVCAGSSVARADWRDTQGGAWMHYELSALHDVDDTGATPRARDLLLAGARLHGFVGHGSTIAYHVGIDLAAGSTVDRAGFAYDVALFPVGVAARFGDTGVVAFGAGIGAMGAVGALDDALTLPIEATIELGGGRVRVLARARALYLAAADARQSGARSAPFADELDATFGVRIGRHYEEYDFPSGNGYWAGIAYREMLDSRFAGLVLGYSIDGATRRRTRSTMRE